MLEQVVQEKLALLKQLEHSVQARDRLQKAAGLEDGIEGGSGLVADAGPGRSWPPTGRH